MPKPEQVDWYDVPQVYSLIFSESTARELQFLKGIRAAYLSGGPSRVFEPACGPGRVLQGLGSESLATLGLDKNHRMLQYARTQARTSQLPLWLLLGDMTRCPIAEGSFDFAFCLVSSFLHLRSERDARRHLGSIAHVLKDDGIYVLGLHLCDYRDRSPRTEKYAIRDDGLEVKCEISFLKPDPDKRTRMMEARISVRNGPDAKRQIQSRWPIRTYSARQLHNLLASVPALEVESIFDFDYDLSKPTVLDDDRLDKVLVLRRRRRQEEVQ